MSLEKQLNHGVHRGHGVIQKLTKGATAALHLSGVGMGVASRARFKQALGWAIALSGAYLLG